MTSFLCDPRILRPPEWLPDATEGGLLPFAYWLVGAQRLSRAACLIIDRC